MPLPTRMDRQDLPTGSVGTRASPFRTRAATAQTSPAALKAPASARTGRLAVTSGSAEQTEPQQHGRRGALSTGLRAERFEAHRDN